MTFFMLQIFLLIAEKLNEVNFTFLLMLLIITIFRTKPTLNNNKNEDTSIQIIKVMNEMELLKWRNNELRMLLSNYKLADKPIDQRLKQLQKMLLTTSQIRKTEMPSNISKCEPSLQFEVTRRRIMRQITDFWLYTKDQLGFINDNTTKFRFSKIVNLVTEYKRVILSDLLNLSNMNGLEDWRKKEAQSLSTLVQKRLNYLQNPKDCREAKKFNCFLSNQCGFGCQIHHLVYCLIMAYGYNRTLIVNSNNWHYKNNGWEIWFKPMSDKCTNITIWSHPNWTENYTDLEITLPLLDYINPRPPILPLAIPEDLAPRLVRLHGHPIVWWVGQFVKYLFRPQISLQKIINETAKSIGFKKPIVGIHVRRTDKIIEAPYQRLFNYMKHVEEFYQQLSLKQKIKEKRVYIATDDTNIFKLAEKRFPEFKFIGDPSFAQTASLHKRYTAESLKGIILDVYFLSMTDYLVCTFSSNICRLSYEFLQTFNPDAAFNFQSLDSIYYFGSKDAPYHKVTFNHQPEVKDEIVLKKGDKIKILHNFRNGYSKGYNTRTKQRGKFPSFKTANKIQIAKFPTYPEVKVQLVN